MSCPRSTASTESAAIFLRASGCRWVGTTEMDVTYYVALPFVAADDGIVAGEAVRANPARIDVLVNNGCIGYFGAVEEIDPAISRQLFDVNRQHDPCGVAGIRHRRNAKIVNLTSIGGLKAHVSTGFSSNPQANFRHADLLAD